METHDRLVHERNLLLKAKLTDLLAAGKRIFFGSPELSVEYLAGSKLEDLVVDFESIQVGRLLEDSAVRKDILVAAAIRAPASSAAVVEPLSQPFSMPRSPVIVRPPALPPRKPSAGVHADVSRFDMDMPDMQRNIACYEALLYHSLAFQAMTGKDRLLLVVKNYVCANLGISQRIHKQLVADITPLIVPGRILSHLEFLHASWARYISSLNKNDLEVEAGGRRFFQSICLMVSSFGDTGGNAWGNVQTNAATAISSSRPFDYSGAVEFLKQFNMDSVKRLHLQHRGHYELFLPLFASTLTSCDQQTIDAIIAFIHAQEPSFSADTNVAIYSYIFRSFQTWTFDSVADGYRDNPLWLELHFRLFLLLGSIPSQILVDGAHNLQLISKRIKLFTVKLAVVDAKEKRQFGDVLLRVYEFIVLNLRMYHERFFAAPLLLTEYLDHFVDIAPLAKRLADIQRGYPLTGEILSVLKTVLNDNIQVQYFQRVEKSHSLQQELEGSPNLLLAKIELTNDLFLARVSVFQEKFMPIFTRYLSKIDMWKQIFEPVLLQFRAEIFHIFDTLQSERVFDADVIKILKDLHMINSVVYQIAISLLGKHSHESIPFLDLDFLAGEYVGTWFSQLKIKSLQFVERSVQRDVWHIEDTDLNISSSVGDLFAYLHSIVDIFFSLPFTTLDDRNSVTPHIYGLAKTVNEFLKPFCDIIGNCVCEYTRILSSESSGIDLRDPAFKSFCERRKYKSETGSFKDYNANIKKLYVRINNVVVAKQRFYNLLCCKVKNFLREKGEFTVRICDEAFESGAVPIGHHLMRILDYTALKTVHVGLREDLVDTLYLTNSVAQTGIGTNSLHHMVKILRGVMEDYMRYISADQLLKSESESAPMQINSMALLISVFYFSHFLRAYESIVIGDLFSQRLFRTADTTILLQDIKLVAQIFSDGLDFDGEHLPMHAVKGCLKPLEFLLSALYTLDTPYLIKMHDKLASDKSTEASPLPSPLPPSSLHLESENVTNLSLTDVISYISETERDRRKYAPAALIILPHDWTQFTTNASKTSGNSNTITITTRQLVHAIARRTGYAHPTYFPVDTSTQEKTNQIVQGIIAPTAKEDIDPTAAKFMRKFGVKHWLDKRLVKAESFFNSKK